MRLIDADVMIDILRKSHESHATNSREESLLDRDIRLIKEQAKYHPVIIEERPHGEWIYKGGKYWCSSCGEKAIYHSHVKEPLPHLTNFCPNCGASMVSSNSEIEKSKSETREGEAK